jgi:hypothetical protein
VRVFPCHGPSLTPAALQARPRQLYQDRSGPR